MQPSVDENFELNHEHLTYDDLLRIVELIKSSEQFSEFRLKVGEIEVELRRRDAASASDGKPTQLQTSGPAIPTVKVAAPAAEPTPSRATTSISELQLPAGAYVIRSPMVGTFYRAPEPSAAPFVEVGQAVEPGTIVCIIEVMKLMNSIVADVRGKVLHVLVDDAASVQAAQPLIVVQPDSR